MSQSGDPYAAVNPGAPARPSARTENALRAAGKKHANTKFGVEGPEGPFGSPRGAVRVRNAGLSTLIDEYSIVGLNGAAVPLDNDTRAVDADPVFNATVPGFTLAIASTREPAAFGDIVEAITHGPAVCRVNVEDESHGFATRTTGTLYLTSNAAFGAPILEKQSGTGLKLAVVLLGGDLIAGGYPGYSGGIIGALANTTSAAGIVWTPPNGLTGVQLRGAGVHKVTATVPAFIEGQSSQFGLAWRFTTSTDGNTWTPSGNTYPLVSGNPSYFGAPPAAWYTGISTFQELFTVGSADLFVTVQIGALCATVGILFGTPIPKIPGYLDGQPMGQIFAERLGINYGFG